jgi:hypothetical protein
VAFKRQVEFVIDELAQPAADGGPCPHTLAVVVAQLVDHRGLVVCNDGLGRLPQERLGAVPARDQQRDVVLGGGRIDHTADGVLLAPDFDVDPLVDPQVTPVHLGGVLKCRLGARE